MILLILALAGLAYAVLYLAGREALVARSAAAVLQARLAAEGGLRQVVAAAGSSPIEPRGEPLSVTTLASGGVGDEGRFRVVGRWLDREFLLLEGTGWVEGRPGDQRVARAVWLLDPAARVGELEAVVEYGTAAQVLQDGAIVEDSVAEAPPAWAPELCAALAPTVDSLFPRGRVSRGRRWEPPVGSPAAGASFPDPAEAPFPSLGLLRLRDVVDRAERLLEGVVRTLPDGEPCESTGGEAGTPEECLAPLYGSKGTVVLDGAAGWGVLAVTGDLTVTNGARFTGLVLVGGDLQVEGGAEIRGFVQVGGSATVGTASRVVGAACPALAALLGSQALRSPIPVAGGSWLTPF